ncbi:MAG: hypothetical protein PF487_13210, partial [Bacteroidales bacterium]|nr:hypothetical protein [Bacteroidales bacterium]
TWNTPGISEILEDGKTGFLIDFPDKDLSYGKMNKSKEKLAETIFEKCSLLIENKKLREEMSKSCIDEIRVGKFSIKERNKKLKRIYEESLL